MKTRLCQDGGGNREAERGCLFYAWLSFEPTAQARRVEAAEGSAWPRLKVLAWAAGLLSPVPTQPLLQPLPQKAALQETSFAANPRDLWGPGNTLHPENLKNSHPTPPFLHLPLRCGADCPGSRAEAALASLPSNV